MKVQITKKSKMVVTLDESPIIQKIIDYCKEDTSSVADYAKHAMRYITKSNIEFKIYDATAEIAKNQKAWNHYTEDSKDIDVWVEFKAFNKDKGFYIVGVYLSDLWRDNLNYAYIQHYILNN